MATPNPATPDNGVYVYDLQEQTSQLDDNSVWSLQTQCILSDKTILAPMPGIGVAADTLYFHYSDDRGATWSRCSTAIIKVNPIELFSIICDDSDNIYVVTEDTGGLQYLHALTWGGSDVTLEATSPDLNTSQGISLYAIDDPGTGSSYTGLVYVAPSSSLSMVIWGWDGSTSWNIVGVVSKASGYNSVDVPHWIPWTAGTNSPYYGGSDDVAYLAQSEGLGGTTTPLQIVQISHSSGTTFAISEYEETPSGWPTITSGRQIIGAGYDSVDGDLWVLFWDDLAGEVKTAKAAIGSWNSAWTSTTATLAEDATYSVTETKEHLMLRSFYSASERKFYTFYSYDLQSFYLYATYDIAGDSWSSWSSRALSAKVDTLLSPGHVDYGHGSGYTSNVPFMVLDDSNNWFFVWDEITGQDFSTTTSSGWGIWG